jgi:transposase-like protein
MKRSRYSNNAKLRMVRAAEASGNIDRWARESRMDPRVLRAWLKERDAGRLKHEAHPGEPSAGGRGKPAPVTQAAPLALLQRQAADVGKLKLQVKILQTLVQRAVAAGFDPVGELGL